MIPIVSIAAVDMIVDLETGGRADYDPRPTWPGGASGVTIGIGCDIGYEAFADVAREFGVIVGAPGINALKSVSGLKGAAARDAPPRVRGVTISFDEACDVFKSASLPRYAAATLSAFPGSGDLPADCFGALVSLVLNRGADMDGDRRREMAQIRAAIIAGTPQAVPGLIRAMKRLWATTGPKGLVIRREREARLFEAGLAGR